MTHKNSKYSFNHVKDRGYNKNCLFIYALDVIEGIFVVLYVSHMGLTHCYKTVVFYIYLYQLTIQTKRIANFSISRGRAATHLYQTLPEQRACKYRFTSQCIFISSAIRITFTGICLIAVVSSVKYEHYRPIYLPQRILKTLMIWM